jgi:hypothetical protein
VEWKRIFLSHRGSSASCMVYELLCICTSQKTNFNEQGVKSCPRCVSSCKGQTPYPLQEIPLLCTNLSGELSLASCCLLQFSAKQAEKFNCQMRQGQEWPDKRVRAYVFLNSSCQQFWCVLQEAGLPPCPAHTLLLQTALSTNCKCLISALKYMLIDAHT